MKALIRLALVALAFVPGDSLTPITLRHSLHRPTLVSSPTQRCRSVSPACKLPAEAEPSSVSSSPAGAVEVAQPRDYDPASASGLPVLILCCLIAAICSLDRVVMSVAILPMSAEYQWSDSTKGAVAAAFSLGYCLALLPTGLLASTTSPKAVL